MSKNVARRFAGRGASRGEPVPAGMRLRERLAGRRLSPEAALVLVHPIVEALARLHAAGKAHGAVDQDSVLVTLDGGMRLVGTGPGDALADVAAVGGLLHTLIAGPARSAPGCSSLRAFDRRVSPELDRLVRACQAHASSKRPRDAGVLLARLSPLVPCALERLDAERALLLCDPDEWQRRWAAQAASRALSDAERARAAGDELGALAAIERVLAHRPEDPERLAARSPGPAPEVPLPPSLPAWTSGLAAALGTGLLLAATVGGVMWMAIEDEEVPREVLPSTRSVALAAPVDLAVPTMDDPSLLAARASLHAAAGQLDAALADLTRAIELAPSAPDHRYARSLLRRRMSDHEGALRDLGAACALAHEEACGLLALEAP